MEPYSASSGWAKVPVSSATQPISDQTILPRQDSEPQSAIDSNASHAKLIRALTELTERAGFPPFVIASQGMLDLIVTIEQARDSSAPVLITGETGTGKELIARAVHALSNRSGRKFIAINCAALNRELIESHLFGHQRGSFTGAFSDSKGVIRAAEGGTLLLDEVGELPLDVQPKLLRFLQEGEVQPVGDTKSVKTDARVIAATNRDLEEGIRAGRFRADLFERLNLLRLRIPPLRERREEIPLFISHFLNRYQEEMHKQGLQLSDEAIVLLLGYDWPRNVRQLANEIYRLVIGAGNDDVIGPNRLSPEVRDGANSQPTSAAAIVGSKIVIDLNLPYNEMKDEVERLAIINALQETSGNILRAAARLQISRVGLNKAIKRLEIDVERNDRSDYLSDYGR